MGMPERMTAAELLALQGQGKGRRRAKAPVEDPIQITIVAGLRLVLPDDAIVHYSPNEQRGRDQEEAMRRQARLKKLGVFAGWTDLTVIHGPRIIFLEVKGPDGALSESQRLVRDRLVAWGWPYGIVRSLEEAIAACKSAGFPIRPMKV